MIVTDKKVRTVEGSKPIDEMEYFIDQKNIIHITAMLRNMYSNPVRACIREYAANAVDSHRQAGKTDVPIEVHVPSNLSPVFKVRDYGPGLSVEETKQLLCGFGSSGDHKRASNSYIGGFGIGAKVGFAVASAFTYTIWHGGKKRIWSNYLDEFDASRASMLSEEDSDEPTGIEVAIPVEEDRREEFEDELTQAFMWYSTPPTLIGSTLTLTSKPTVLVSDKLHIKTATAHTPITIQLVNRESGYLARREKQSPRIVMGDIEYPIEVTTTTVGIEQRSLTNAKVTLLNSLVIHAPVGTVQLAPSRESLQYSQSTKNTLNRIITKVLTPDYAIGLFRDKASKKATLVQAYTDAQYYSTMLGESVASCLATLYPQYSGHVEGKVFDPFPGAIDKTLYVATVPVTYYTNYDYKTGWFGSKRDHLNSCFFTTNSGQLFVTPLTSGEYSKHIGNLDSEITSTNKLSILRRLMLHVSKQNRADWMFPHGKKAIEHAKGDKTISILFLVTDNVASLKTSSAWNLVNQGTVTELPLQTLMSYTPKDGEELVTAYHRPNTRTSRGRSSRATSSTPTRKFSQLTTELIPVYGGKASDSWKSLLAKDVDASLGYSVPMDGFVMHAPPLAYNGEGGATIDNRDTMRFIQRTILKSADRKKFVLNDKPIIGIRIKEYNSTVQKYKFESFWARLKKYFAEYMKANQITNNHLVALRLMSTKLHSTNSDALTASPESVMLQRAIYNRVVEAGDASHKLWTEANTWTPYLNWAYRMLNSDDTEHIVFRDMFLECYNYWLGGRTACNYTRVPFIQDKASEELWQSIISILKHTSGLQQSVNTAWITVSRINNLESGMAKAMLNLVRAYPGITAFLPQKPGYTPGNKDDIMWDVVARKSNKACEPSSGLVDHVFEYINSVNPIKEV